MLSSDFWYIEHGVSAVLVIVGSDFSLLAVAGWVFHVNQYLAHTSADSLNSEHSLLHHNITCGLNTYMAQNNIFS